ncbi:unnamed protein product, partial [Lampetra fluviatilis]
EGLSLLLALRFSAPLPARAALCAAASVLPVGTLGAAAAQRGHSQDTQNVALLRLPRPHVHGVSVRRGDGLRLCAVDGARLAALPLLPARLGRRLLPGRLPPPWPREAAGAADVLQAATRRLPERTAQAARHQRTQLWRTWRR